MKTVGEFLSAGLNFVEGDCVSDYLGGEVNFLDECDKNDCNEHLGFSLSFVTEFAWRENTGLKPEFKGLIDVLVGDDKNSEQFNCINASDLVWDTNPLSRVIKWRPSLNQPQQWPDNSRMDIIGQNGNDGLHYENTAQQVEALAVNAKPIFTQAMADEYTPQSGCECEIMLDGYWQKCFIVGLSKKGNPVIEIGAHCVESVGCKYRAIDTRTDREKAIDAALHEWPVADKATLEMAYDFWRVGEI